MAKPKLTTAQRQEALFGKKPAPVPAKPFDIPVPNEMPTSSASDADVADLISQPAPPAAKPGARFYRFRSRHTANGPWTNAPGRWTRIDQASAAAQAAKSLDPRLEVQLFAVQ